MAACFFMCSGGLSGASASAQPARIELHPFATESPTDQELLTGRTGNKTATIAGELRIPRRGTDRLPAVVLIHGSPGPLGMLDDWVKAFNAIDVATFLVDSFTGRGFESAGSDEKRIGRLTMMLDGYHALAVLAAHPRIDPSRVMAMGFSRGGQAVLYSSLKRFWRMHAPAARFRFAGYIALYPACNTTYLEDDDVMESPIRLFKGMEDDVEPCRSYVQRLRRSGKDASMTEYPGAHHGFDDTGLKTVVRNPAALRTELCPLVEITGGRIVHRKTKQPLDAADPCVQKGNTLAYDPKAHASARQAITDFVATTLIRKTGASKAP